MRIVIDTNILMSAIFFGGLPEMLIKLVIEGALKVVASGEIIQEYEDTIQDMILKTGRAVFRFPLDSFLGQVEIMKPKTTVAVCRDSDDDKFIACALDGGCTHIISGDNDLLHLKEYHGIKIVPVRDFLKECGVL